MELGEIIAFTSDDRNDKEIIERSEASLITCIAEMGRERLAAIHRCGGRLLVDTSGEPWFTWPSIPANEHESYLASIELPAATSDLDPDEIRSHLLAKAHAWADEVAARIRDMYHDFDF